MSRTLTRSLLNSGFLAGGILTLLLCWWTHTSFQTSLQLSQEMNRREQMLTELRSGLDICNQQLHALLAGNQGQRADVIRSRQARNRWLLDTLQDALPAEDRLQIGQRLELVYRRVVTHQDRCLELWTEGQSRLARRILDNPDYRSLLRVRSANLGEFSERLHELDRQQLQAQVRHTLQLGGTVAGMLLLVALAWFSAMRSLHRWRSNLGVYNRQLAHQTSSLRESNWALDQKVAERTKDLAAQNIELQQAKERAEAANQAKNSFLSSMSHELKTPLTSIHSYATLLRDFCSDEDQEIRLEFLEVIVLESERLGRLINDVLDFSMIELGRIKLHPTWISARAIGDRAMDIGGSLSIQKDVRFELDCSTDLELHVDEDRVQQVLANLLTNAWKFSDDGQAVRLEVRGVADGLEMSVRDRGPGIPDAVKERVFGKFQQAGDTLTNKPQGTGLGLSIVQNLVELHEAHIHCEDNPGGGALFRLRFPAHRVRQAAPALATGEDPD